MTGEHIRGIPRTYEKEITLADTPYTLSVGYNCVKVDTTGGNVRVNLPDTNYPIDVIKTSSDAYIVTVWVGGTQIGEIAGELSKITVENAEVTKDEPWFPYDAIVGIAGVSGDGGEVLAKDRYGRVIAGGRGVAGTDDAAIINAAINYVASNPYVNSEGGVVNLSCGQFNTEAAIIVKRSITLCGSGRDSTIITPSGAFNAIENFNRDAGNVRICIKDLKVGNLVSSPNVGLNGIDLKKCTYAIIENVAATENNLSGICILDGYWNTIRNCLCLYNTSHGIESDANADTILVDNSDCEYNALYGISIPGGGAHRIQNSYIEANTSGGIYVGAEKSHIFDNIISANSVFNLFVTGDENYIHHNEVNNCANGYGIRATCTDSIFDHNIITLCKYGVQFYSTGSGNTFEHNILSLITTTYLITLNTANNNIFRWNIMGGATVSIATTGCILRYNSGYVTENFGSSTGTGSEQPIAHGLAAIPVGCKAWITYKDAGGDYITEFVRFNATHIKVNLDTGIAYTWGIGAI